MSSSESPLKSFLESSRLISRAEADDLWQESKEDQLVFSRLLLEYGKLSEDDLQRAKSHLWGIPLINLSDKKIDRQALQMIAGEKARRLKRPANGRFHDRVLITPLDAFERGNKLLHRCLSGSRWPEYEE